MRNEHYREDKMPPKTRINKQMIIDAAFQIVKEQGHEQMNARTIAERLNCSTQPVMYNFKTVEEIREEVYKLADEYHSEYIMPRGAQGINPLLELGLNYIRFGYEEKNLFRFLFQTNGFAGLNMKSLVSDPAAGGMIQMVSQEMNIAEDKARDIFFHLFVSAHGIASLLANNAMEYEEQTFTEVLEDTYRNSITGR